MSEDETPRDRVRAIINTLSVNVWCGTMDAIVKDILKDSVRDAIALLRDMELRDDLEVQRAIADLTAEGLSVPFNVFEHDNTEKRQKAKARSLAVNVLKRVVDGAARAA